MRSWPTVAVGTKRKDASRRHVIPAFVMMGGASAWYLGRGGVGAGERGHTV
jgi:hypothetical protein